LIDEVLGDATSRHMVFLHGWGGSRDSLRGIGTLFQHTHRVHLIDLPGFGEAPAPPPDWGTIHYTDLVQQYLLERITGSVILVGHSFGGRISVRLAARHLPQIRGVVLMGVPGLPQTAFSRTHLRRLGIRWLRKLLVAVKPIAGEKPVAWHTRRFGSKDYLAAGALRSILVRTVNEDLTESARTIACPTLLIWGTDDRETPPWLARRYWELSEGRATLEWLPHKDHHLYTGTGAHLCGFKIRNWADTFVHA
jgi:pimeloyl-ACP methyl ester carboxylesterase